MLTPPPQTFPSTPVPEAQALQAAHRLSLHLELHRQSPQDAWWAELRCAEGAPPMLFASLPALIGYIARLDPPQPSGGLR